MNTSVLGVRLGLGTGSISAFKLELGVRRVCSVSVFLRQPGTKFILHVIMIAIMSLICALFPGSIWLGMEFISWYL